MQKKIPLPQRVPNFCLSTVKVAYSYSSPVIIEMLNIYTLKAKGPQTE